MVAKTKPINSNCKVFLVCVPVLLHFQMQAKLYMQCSTAQACTFSGKVRRIANSSTVHYLSGHNIGSNLPLCHPAFSSVLGSDVSV